MSYIDFAELTDTDTDTDMVRIWKDNCCDVKSYFEEKKGQGNQRGEWGWGVLRKQAGLGQAVQTQQLHIIST